LIRQQVALSWVGDRALGPGYSSGCSAIIFAGHGPKLSLVDVPSETAAHYSQVRWNSETAIKGSH
jgi:hypothetical protein